MVAVGPISQSIFRSKQQCLRMWYKYHGEAGYFHTFRVPNVRAFNNTVVEIKGEEEAMGMLKLVTLCYVMHSQRIIILYSRIHLHVLQNGINFSSQMILMCRRQ